MLFSCSVVSDSSWPHELQHTRIPCPSLSLRGCSNSCPLSWWCPPTISSSVVPVLNRSLRFSTGSQVGYSSVVTRGVLGGESFSLNKCNQLDMLCSLTEVGMKKYGIGILLFWQQLVFGRPFFQSFKKFISGFISERTAPSAVYLLELAVSCVCHPELPSELLLD